MIVIGYVKYVSPHALKLGPEVRHSAAGSIKKTRTAAEYAASFDGKVYVDKRFPGAFVVRAPPSRDLKGAAEGGADDFPGVVHVAKLAEGGTREAVYVFHEGDPKVVRALKQYGAMVYVPNFANPAAPAVWSKAAGYEGADGMDVGADGLDVGAIGGAVAGFAVAGPVGALIGGVVGAFVGATTKKTVAEKDALLAYHLAKRSGLRPSEVVPYQGGRAFTYETPNAKWGRGGPADRYAAVSMLKKAINIQFDMGASRTEDLGSDGHVDRWRTVFV